MSLHHFCSRSPQSVRYFRGIAPEPFQLVVFPQLMGEYMNNQLIEIKYYPSGLVIGLVPLPQALRMDEFFRITRHRPAVNPGVAGGGKKVIEIAVHTSQVHDCD